MCGDLTASGDNTVIFCDVEEHDSVIMTTPAVQGFQGEGMYFVCSRKCMSIPLIIFTQNSE